MKNTVFILGSILFALAASFHFAALFQHLNESSFIRNSIFVFLDAFCVYGFLKRPQYFNYFFFLFTLQQIYSHGKPLISGFRFSAIGDWIGLGALIIMPVLCLELFKRK